MGRRLIEQAVDAAWKLASRRIGSGAAAIQRFIPEPTSIVPYQGRPLTDPSGAFAPEDFTERGGDQGGAGARAACWRLNSLGMIG